MKQIKIYPKVPEYKNGRRVLYTVCGAQHSDVQEAYARDNEECGQIPCKSIDAIGNVKVYESITEGSLATGIDKSSISRAIRGVYKHAGNLKWKEIE